jgi:hypothetical protein
LDATNPSVSLTPGRVRDETAAPRDLSVPHPIRVIRLIRLHPAVPAKPAVGAACNGCGVCCAAEPCPLGIVLSRRTRGACVALDWDEAAVRYRCGALATPQRWLRWLPPAWGRALAARWIAAGRGCDSDLEPATASSASR